MPLFASVHSGGFEEFYAGRPGCFKGLLDPQSEKKTLMRLSSHRKTGNVTTIQGTSNKVR